MEPPEASRHAIAHARAGSGRAGSGRASGGQGVSAHISPRARKSGTDGHRPVVELELVQLHPGELGKEGRIRAARERSETHRCARFHVCYKVLPCDKSRHTMYSRVREAQHPH